MKILKQLTGWVALALVFAMPGGTFAAGFSFDTTFTHQGRLRFDGKPANGLYNFQFKLYTNLLGGNQLGSTANYTNVPASNGLYRIDLDFGDVFSGGARYIETAVQSATNRTGFQTLAPRQPVNAVPYAMWARRGGTETWDLNDNVRFRRFPPSDGALSGGVLLYADDSGGGILVFAAPAAAKKVDSVKILVTYREPAVLAVQVEIRSLTGGLRAVISSQPIDLYAVPLKQWQTFTLNGSDAALTVQPGEYLGLRVIGNNFVDYAYREITILGEATVHDVE